MGRQRDEDEPTLYEAWELLAGRMDLAVEPLNDRSVRVTGQARGRPLVVEVDGKGARSEGWRFLFGVNTISSRNRREKWRTSISVGCSNPRGLTGVIESVVDANDPAWNPRVYDPRNGRSVTSEPAMLGDHVLTADTHERLMSITPDVRIEVSERSIGIEHHDTALPGKGARFVAGSFIHQPRPTDSPIPWPDRAIVGPPWWIDLLCDLADALDRP